MGSNTRETEEEGAMNWVTFLSEFEADGKIDVFEDDVNTLSSFTITLADILNFMTGSTEIPPMGFQPEPSIIDNNTGTALPIASTCSNCLTLPLSLSYATFRYNVAFRMKNSPGFLRI